MNRAFLITAYLVAGMEAIGSAMAQIYPSRPITMIVPPPPLAGRLTSFRGS
jgi:hypothetical protein